MGRAAAHVGGRQARADPGRAQPGAGAAVGGLVRDGREPGGAAGAGVRAHGRGPELVAWRTAEGALAVGPGACPHLGAALCDAPVHEDLVCRWHGMALGARRTAGLAHAARVRRRRAGLGAPRRPRRGPRHRRAGARPAPAASLDAVATVIGHCEPQDVMANRLDPWHGAWLHPYSFTALKVLSAPPVDCPTAEDRFLVEVTFTLGKRFGVPVHAAFSCPDPRTVTMEIVDGEGTGSVVETHATPLRPDADGPPAHGRHRSGCGALRPPRLRGHPPGRGRAAAAGRRTRPPGSGATTSPTPSGGTPCGLLVLLRLGSSRGSGPTAACPARRPVCRGTCARCAAASPGTSAPAGRRTPWRASAS